jgi:CRISPR-associated Csx2 family protein
MATRLVMFLGRPNFVKVERGSHGNAYEMATYRFEDGAEHRTSFFGVALFDWLRAKQTRIDTLHVFGTSGSQWDALVELVQQANDFEGERLEHHLELGDAARAERVSTAQLERAQGELGEALGVSTRCHLVSADAGLGGQYEVFNALAGICEPGDTLLLDITHAFRHLSMLGISSAMFFRQALNVDISGIYYGKLAGPNQIALVAKLDALDEIAEWTAALSIFERTGLLGPIAELYAKAGLNEQAAPLSALAFHLATSRHTRLADSARQAVVALGKVVEHPVHEIIGPQLIRALRSLFLRDAHVALIERQLAAQAMRSSDWTQAAINLYESLLSAAIRDASTRGDRHMRTAADNAFKDQRPLDNADMNMFHELKNLRNIFAHGNDADAGNVRQRALANNVNTCRQFLEDAAQMVDRVLPGLIAAPLV